MDDKQAKSNDQSSAAPSSSEQMAASDQALTPWDDLARTLGAEPSPKALERPRLENAPPHQEPAISAEQPLSEPPVTPALQHGDTQTSSDTKTGDWAGLANELGVTIDDSPEPATPAPDSAGGDEEAIPSSQPQSPAVPLAEDLQEEDPTEAWGDLPSFQEEEPSLDTFAEELILPVDELDATDSPAEEGLSGEVARSVFDALFLSGAAAAEALDDLLPLRGSDTRKQEIMSTDSQADQEQSEPEQSADEQREQGIEDQHALPPQERTEKSVSRRGTRRRRGRGRRQRGRDGESEVTNEDSAAKDSYGSGSDLLESELETADIAEARSDPLDSHGVDPIAKDTPSQLDQPGYDSFEEREPTSEDSDDESRKSNSHRRRPRRRRGRGRGVATRETDDLTASRERELSPAAGSKSAATDLETDDTASALKAAAPRDHRSRTEPTESGDVGHKNVTEENVTDQNEKDEEGKSSSHRGSPSKRPSHRNIPTWEEAMSVIVDSNIESRKKSPTPTGRSGSSRSRGRGGRRRKKT